MRLFIAIRPDRPVKKALLGVQDAWRRQGVRGNYTPPENLHLTLAFIGEYSDPDAVLAAMEELRFSPIPLRLDRLGAFDALWWAGFAEGEELDTLVRQLRRALAEAAIPFDRKRFLPHITLLRKPVCPQGAALRAVQVPPAQMRAERLSLMLSTRGKNGMIYTELGAVAADAAANAPRHSERTETP